ncbi:YlmC/YmxH family sporulation protein [Haloimpatiens massiliensis]|uniref:YlmC/YmxH family sporulation protein n=1 Tax=Haloimpatiens massiliensis TaxID=1658110 RepID=UPI000C8663EE|nr:YlmC/YmxH family sporulation protein [Haloimpatiens massiliensis]
MFSINNLKMMEVIDIDSGAKLGFIKDFKIDTSEYKIISIILPGEKGVWFSKNEDLEISWECIIKIGVDVILVQSPRGPLVDEQ